MATEVELGKSKKSAASNGKKDGADEKPEVEYVEHAWSFEELEGNLAIKLNVAQPGKSAGLTAADAKKRLVENGPNALTPPPVKPWYFHLLAKFLDPFMILLEIVAVLCFILFGTNQGSVDNEVNLYIAVVLVFVICLTSVLSFYQEGQSAKVMNTFKNMMSESARVRRGGQEIDVPAEDLVLGDLVVIESGKRVPADLRIIQSDSLKVENSSFTGEPEPVEMCLEKTDDEALHSKNLAFNSAMVVEGKGLGIVVRTGDNTMIGNIASLVGQTKGGKSTLEAEVIGFVHLITKFAILSAIVFYAVALIKTCGFEIGGDCDPAKSFINVFIVILIANVPEGLPATVTSCLTVCAQRLATRQVFVKRLDCVETLGSCTVVASDKTGTLTQNKMTVSHLWLDCRTRTTEYMTREGNVDKWDSFKELVMAGALCNMCKYEADPNAPAVAAAGSLDLSQATNRPSIATMNNYTLSKRPAAVVGPLGNHQMTYQGTLARRSMQQQKGEAAKSTILNPGFFDRGAAALEASTGAGAGSGADTVRGMANLPNIVRQLSSVTGQATVGRGSQATFGRNSQATFGRNSQALQGAGTLSRLSVNALGRNTFLGGLPLVEAPPRIIVGNPSDKAVFTFCNLFKDIETTREEYPQLYIIPFNSRLKYMKTIHRPPPTQADQRRVVILKGAPEIVLKSCTRYMSKGEELPIDAGFSKRFEEVYKEIAGQGERVLGFARKHLPLSDFPASVDDKYKDMEDKVPHEEFTFLGLISLIDPPKNGVPDAVLRCKNAGIRVMMITGDHPLTAEAIAKKVNIIRDYSMRDDIAQETGESPADITEDRIGAAVITCKDLEHYKEEDWNVLLDKPELVFARASPQDKLDICRHLRARDEVVAMTGDGVNDSPALKNADIGIAMGIMGTEVAKGAANVVLMDDDFCSIVNGIEEGRVLFDNLTKTIAYTLTHLVPELMAVLINICFTIPAGMSSLMILSIDLLTEVPPAISYAWEQAESNVMDRPPRNRKVDRLVRPSLLSYAYLQAGMIEAGICLFAYFMVYGSNGVTPLDLFQFGVTDDFALRDGRILSLVEQTRIVNSAMTAFYATLILSQVVNVFVCKTRFVPMLEHGVFNNIMMNYGVMVEVGILIAIVFIPGLNDAFSAYGRQPIQFFLFFLVSGAILVGWGELRKFLIRVYPTSCFANAFAF
ncbi:hypothetical protein NSK_007331 [Nannochloropsis salina CCMP1776]|jgi:magnesium-transporting ATPase (P-type)|uniref:Cation-transporting P-type ATPase N-terminal domain-containing protein n=1 Tax=Nannochloropsis salina CCMP1776 TaxID=1027361 RepID=A0A4D9CQI4_9STRA|nr:hypothetical protein NSK_007331 [Nannochloropsis salina CCMP1776]|eukprot:TFJ81370.1 hypothetical protein NSK_007331 [Nannochloropsis salina CCMP1776]